VGKKKLIHFEENLTFSHLFQPNYHHLAERFPLRANWHAGFFRNDHPIITELGCGKGEYTVGLAARHPELNFVGIDWKGARLWRGCKSVEEQSLPNAAFVRTMIGNIEKIFAPGEVAGIWITFPDPQRKKERLRLTSPLFLEKYRRILTPGGAIHLKTDDRFLYDYTLDVIRQGGHILLEATDDLYQTHSDDELTGIRTFYENQWLAIGKKINYLRFQLHSL